MIDAIERALEGRTRSFRDEIALHGEIAAALRAAGIGFEQEVTVPGVGRVDFVIEETIATEVKAQGCGLGPVRQLFRYLEDRRFTMGLLLTCRATPLPVRHFERSDGSTVPVYKIELWRNALL